MGIHKEGRTIILITTILFLIISGAALYFLPTWLGGILSFAALLGLFFVIRFFRVPKRIYPQDEHTIFSPADGTVVVIEETDETEYLKERRIQVSVFMSVWNVHINWFPISGVVEYFRHHHGKFLVAWHPKSSEENERTTIVVRNGEAKILFRQIAGYVARRIVSYVEEGCEVKQNTQCGFIKFGSRVDLFLPLDAEICVKLGDKVTGTQTILARLNEK